LILSGMATGAFAAPEQLEVAVRIGAGDHTVATRSPYSTRLASARAITALDVV
jgi:hypothetical protein